MLSEESGAVGPEGARAGRLTAGVTGEASPTCVFNLPPLFFSEGDSLKRENSTVKTKRLFAIESLCQCCIEKTWFVAFTVISSSNDFKRIS